MKLSGAAALVLFSLSSAANGSNPVLRKNEEVTPSLPEVGSVIEGSYIIRMDPTSTGANSLMNGLATALGASSRDVFSKTIMGFAVKNINATKAEEIAKMEGVASVVPDTVVAYDMLAGSERPVEPEQLGRFSREEKIPYGVTRVNGGRTYRGNNVAFVVDTGIFDHDDLNVDYRRGFTVDASVGMTDNHGHGTQ
jgi:Peptidase inhibitor I9